MQKENMLPKDISPRFHTERQVKAVLGVSTKEFFIMLPVFEQLLQEHKEKSQEGKIKPNNGKEGALKTPKDKLMFMMHYLKCYSTFDHLGYTFDMSGSSAHIWVSKLYPVFIKILVHFNVLPATNFNSPEEMREAFKGFDTLIIDVTERGIQRPQDDIVQNDHFSGKTKKHSVKYTVIASLTFTILYLGTTFSGRNNDFNMLKTEFKPGLNWFETFTVLVDLGYMGFDKNYNAKNLLIPHKKPRKSKNNPNPQLTDEQKKHNRQVGSQRVIVENAIGGIKRFRSTSDRYRNHIPGLDFLFMLSGAGMWNFHIAHRN